MRYLNLHLPAYPEYASLLSRRQRVNLDLSRIIYHGCFFVALAALTFTWTGCFSEERGRQVFVANCAGCHQDAPSYLEKRPPRLDGLFQTGKLPSGRPATDKQVRATIVEGRRSMPAFDHRLSDRDLGDLIAYLHVLE
jgi:mono/diheme cytochrome c family protein